MFHLVVLGLLSVSFQGAEAELTKLETQWNNAHLKGDADTLDKLFADELVVTVQGMPLMYKAQSLRITRSGIVKFKKYETTDVKIQVFGDAAVVTGLLARTRIRGEQQSEDKWRFTKTYVKRNGTWQVVAWHGSDAPK